jgi:gluconolactonase
MLAIASIGLSQDGPLPLVPSSIPIGDVAFISPDARLERVVNGGDFGMASLGNVAVGCDGYVYFSDIKFSNSPASFTPWGTQAEGVIWRYDPSTNVTEVFRSPSGMTNGIAFDAACDLVVAEGADFGGRRITRIFMPHPEPQPESTHRLLPGLAEIVAGLYNGAPFNAPNDLVIDAQGRLYFTDTRYTGHELVEQEVNGVYRVDPDGTVNRIISDLMRPNGVELSPDQNTLYVSDFSNRGEGDALLAYHLQVDGSVVLREVLIAYTERGADGMAVDTEGNLWAAVLDTSRPGVYAYTPEGEEKAYIPLNSPFGTAFGRDSQRHVLYIAASNSLYRIVVNKEGYHLLTPAVVSGVP